jgi:hypothetical protein
MVSWLHCFGPEERQNIMVAGRCVGGGCSPHGSQEVQRETERDRQTEKERKGWRDKIQSSRHAHKDPLPSVGFHLLNIYQRPPSSSSNYQSMNE